ncbi:TonB family protein [Sphingomonas panacisoli]|nr:TonB family protein [Sphingomonas panacisoli]
MALSAATAPAPLAPAGKWVVDYQKDMCIASRAFGTTDNSTLFGIKPSISMDGDDHILFFVVPKSSGNEVRRGQAVITLQPSGQQLKIAYVSAVPKGTNVRGYEVYANAEFAAQLAQATAVSMKAGSDQLSFATGKVEPVLNALKACNESLLRSWGIDPAARASTPPGVSVAKWFPQDSYPAEAKRRGAQGRSVIVVTVSAAGRPTACRVILKADPDLDATTCRLAMRNGQFEAVEGKSDRYAVYAVRWELWDV